MIHMSKESLTESNRCYRCGNLAPAYVNGVQVVRYGYSGGQINLCTDCFREFKSWLDVNRKDEFT